MELKSPKETVSAVTYLSEEDKIKALKLKTESAVQGAFFGGAIGLLFAFYKGKNKYVSGLVGAVLGGLVSNLLTVQKRK